MNNCSYFMLIIIITMIVGHFTYWVSLSLKPNGSTLVSVRSWD